MGAAVPIAAVTLGACIIEKHFTLSRSNPGPDSDFSMEPHEFQAMVEGVRMAERALGQVHYGLSIKDRSSRVFRRSLYITQDLKAGESLSEANLRSIRPGNGLAPKFLKEILGRRAAVDLPRGTPLEWKHIH